MQSYDHDGNLLQEKELLKDIEESTVDDFKEAISEEVIKEFNDPEVREIRIFRDRPRPNFPGRNNPGRAHTKNTRWKPRGRR